ncbi:MAG: hypothetical protein DI527_00405 [Chelatococcus sp.]|nr:MAG: hypothetical protein DI527_00405 [Chelatococcus sp.]
MLGVATLFWGKPKGGGNRNETRFGNGLTININKGSWWDHAAESGGGVLALVTREKGLKGREAIEWLRNNGFSVDDDGQHRRQPQQSNRRDEPHRDRSDPGPAAEPAQAARKKDKGEPTKKLDRVYDYQNEAGELVCQTMRFALTYPDGSTDKTFSQRRPARPDDDPKIIRDGFVYSLKDAGNLVPYRLPELVDDLAHERTIFFVEGEKVVDRLRDELGVPATCNPMGAGKWWEELTPFFADADVVFLPDNDPQSKKANGEPIFHDDGRPKHVGRDHVDLVGSKIKAVARRVRILELPGLKPAKEDASEWIDRGGTTDELYRLVEASALPWAPPAPFVKRHFSGSWFHEISGERPKRDWLLKGLILAKTFGVVFGAPGSGKSFLVADLMLTCSVGALATRDHRPDWFGYKGRPFGVVYVVAEGRDDFIIRLHAWRIENKIPDDAVIPFFFLPTSIDMRSSDVDTMKLADDIRALSIEMKARCGVDVEVIVIDTVARALAGGNENASDVMGAFVINCGKLQEATGAAVLGVHHGGKEVGRGPRGHEALHGAADFEIEVAGATDEGPNSWTVRKLKSGPAGASHKFRLKPLTVTTDEDGDPVTSCVVIAPRETPEQVDAERAKKSLFQPTDVEASFLHVLGDAIEKNGEIAPHGIGASSNVKLVVNVQHVRDLWRDRMSATEAGSDDEIDAKLRTRWSRATKKLVKFGVIGSAKPFLWMTGREVKGVRLRGAEPTESSRAKAEQRQSSAGDGHSDTPISDDEIGSLFGEPYRGDGP